MKYCCTELERKGTCYHEFKKGMFNLIYIKYYLYIYKKLYFYI